MQKIDDNEGSIEDIHEITGEFAGKLPENAHLYRGHVDVDKYVATPLPKNDYPKNEHPRYEEPRREEPPQVDEEGFFKPKERIIVSEDARTVMNRKPFGAPVSDTKIFSGLISR